MATRRQRRGPASRSPSPVQVSSDPELPMLEEMVDWGEEEVASPVRKLKAGTRLDASMSSESQRAKTPSKTQHGSRGKSQPPAAKPGMQPKNKVVSTTTRTKKEQMLEITGGLANFPTLGMTLSSDAVFNTSWVLHGRLHGDPQVEADDLDAPSKSCLPIQPSPVEAHPTLAVDDVCPRDRSHLGHLGCCMRVLTGPKGPPLMR